MAIFSREATLAKSCTFVSSKFSQFMLKELFRFIKSKAFLKHLGVYVLLLAILFWIVISWLGSYTSHNVTVKVPSFNGLHLSELDGFVEDKNVRYLIIDSIYDPKAARGVVVRQEPEQDSDVKAGRTIYLYVTSTMPPSVIMPKLVDRSLRQATAMILSYGLRLGKIRFAPDECSNCVLEQLVKGRAIEAGAIIPKGTVVSLVVGKGLSEEEMDVPCFYGFTAREANKKLIDLSLSMGSMFYDNPKDSLKAFVYRQSPACGPDVKIKKGEVIDFYLTTDKTKISKPPSDSLKKSKKNNENFDDE